MNHVYVDNLVDGILLAIDKPAWGQTFNLTDGRRTTNLEYFTRLAAALGVPKPRLAPAAVFHAAAAVSGVLSRLGVAERQIGHDSVRYLQRPGTYSIERARTVLGYSPEIDLTEGLSRVRRGARA
jgi:nucleoside-diphosphate-sugar epimerase